MCRFLHIHTHKGYFAELNLHYLVHDKQHNVCSENIMLLVLDTNYIYIFCCAGTYHKTK